MPRRLTREFVAEKFAERGWELLEKEYFNASQKLAFRCDKGHEHSICYSNFSHDGCSYCSNKLIGHDAVAKAFKDRGWQLLSIYQNNSQKLDYICGNGHEGKTTWRNFRRAGKCLKCAGKDPSKYKGYKLPTHQKVEESFASKGWQLLSQFESVDKKLDFICDQGHRHAISWKNFQRNHGCAICKKKVVTHEHVEEVFKKKGCTLLSKYQGSLSKLDFICENGHQSTTTWSYFSKTGSCIVCSGMKVFHHQVEEAFSQRGWKLLSRYKNSYEQLEFICQNGHHHSIDWGNFQKGVGCALCSGMKVLPHQVEEAFSQRGWKLLSPYKNSYEKLDFICENGHHHSILWGSVRAGIGCGICMAGGYSRTKPGRLYYIRFDFPDRKPLYKIGITNSTIERRFQRETTPYTVLLDEWHLDGIVPWVKERAILKRHKKHKYRGNPLLQSGNSECFTKDILALDGKTVQLPLALDIA